ncbi:carboxypeptidase-like regulatory domain-containing protein [Winogradskyella psychrotolerans]|uniref:carboxypeptidase-like regulatory domain-containing protein n=1 Tax=Winogradskyella psychrotolerans TaxID=1344585 RepID=UPI0005936602|nr:carboxypeptidase-like regulatory domain-containing protein [Winogradskyella psychrotolerans]
MKITVLLLAVISTCTIYSQTIKGSLTDSLTKAKLPYANLVIKDTKNEVYSNEDGTFNLDISKTTQTDTLVISLIGYHRHQIALTNYNSTNDYVLNL